MFESPKSVFRVRHATTDDITDIVNLRIHAETWLKGAGIEQWTVRTTGESNIREHVEAGTTFVVTTGAGDTIGSLTLNTADLDFWTPDEAQQPALYLYKFMLRSERRGSGLGDLLLDWACARAQMFGARWLRLDCWRTNHKLHRYYEERGFKRLDVREAPGRKSGALFERPVDLRLCEQPTVRLIDETTPSITAEGHLASKPADRYDPDGTAAIYFSIAEELAAMRHEPDPVTGEIDQWSAALDQAARRVEAHGIQLRQANGLYYRVIDGQPVGK